MHFLRSTTAKQPCIFSLSLFSHILCFSYVFLDPTVPSSVFYADYGLSYYVQIPLSCRYICVFILMSHIQSMDEFDSESSSEPPAGSKRHCQHSSKVFQIVRKDHRCCSQECRKVCKALNRQSANMSSSSENKSNKMKKDIMSPPTS